MSDSESVLVAKLGAAARVIETFASTPLSDGERVTYEIALAFVAEILAVAKYPVELSDLKLSVRATNGLRELGIKDIAQLVGTAAVELEEARNFGIVALKEVRSKLAKHGLALRGESVAEESI